MRALRIATLVLIALVLLVHGCSGADGAGPAGGAGQARGGRARRAILVSIDGLMPVAYTEPDRYRLAVPTLRAIVSGGAWARGARSVMPTVTYPAHTTMATGVDPGAHGITGNVAFDPLEKNKQGWRWYAEDIKVPALWDAVEGAGRAAALINWPVTVGARARFVVPEYWRAGTPDDQKLTRALSTPGLLARVEARFPDLWQRLTPPNVADTASIDIAVHLIESSAPDLLMVHIWMVDENQHRSGPWSPQSVAAIETADRQLARLVAACRRRGVWDDTALFVVSDHGFALARMGVRPAAILRERGLLTAGIDGKLVSWRAAAQTNGGTAYVYLADPNDAEAGRLAREAFAPLTTGPGALVRRILEPDAIGRLGGDPTAAFALEAADGVVFADGSEGPWQVPAVSLGQHGYGPDRPEMRASFLAYGPRVRRAALGDVSLTDVAPTIAAWLGVAMPGAAGRAIDLWYPP